jgi:hypothetical protein
MVLLAGCTSPQTSTEQPVLGPANPTRARIDELAGRFGYEPLRTKRLKQGQAEIRIWHHGLSLSGEILQFDGVDGRMTTINDFHPALGHGDNAGKQQRPRLACDWPSLLARLESLDIHELPGQANLTHALADTHYFNSRNFTFVFEVARQGQYRSYAYTDPIQGPPDPEPSLPDRQQVLKIFQLIETEFDVPHQVSPGYFPEPLQKNQVVLARTGASITLFRFTDITQSKVEHTSYGHIELAYRVVFPAGLATSELEEQPRIEGGRHIECHEPYERALLELGIPSALVKACPRADGSLWLLYPNPRSLAYKPWEVAALAITDKFSFDEVNVLDPKWNFQTAFNEYTPPCDTPQ